MLASADSIVGIVVRVGGAAGADSHDQVSARIAITVFADWIVVLVVAAVSIVAITFAPLSEWVICRACRANRADPLNSVIARRAGAEQRCHIQNLICSVTFIATVIYILARGRLDIRNGALSAVLCC